MGTADPLLSTLPWVLRISVGPTSILLAEPSSTRVRPSLKRPMDCCECRWAGIDASAPDDPATCASDLFVEPASAEYPAEGIRAALAVGGSGAHDPLRPREHLLSSFSRACGAPTCMKMTVLQLAVFDRQARVGDPRPHDCLSAVINSCGRRSPTASRERSPCLYFRNSSLMREARTQAHENREFRRRSRSRPPAGTSACPSNNSRPPYRLQQQSIDCRMRALDGNSRSQPLAGTYSDRDLLQCRARH